MPINTSQPNIPARDRFKRTINLISKGYSAPESFPEGKITVYPWDIKIDEWLQQRVRKGNSDTVLIDLLPQLCDLNGCPVEHFVLGEVLLVALVSRSILRDNVLSLSLKCPSCGHEFIDELKVPDQLSTVGEKTLPYDGFDSVKLPVNGDTVTIKPPLVFDYKNSINIAKKSKQSQRLTSLAVCILAVGGGKPDSVKETIDYLTALHPKDLAALEASVERNSPHLSQNIDIQCPECQHTFVHPIDFTTEFFRPALAE